LGPMVSTVIKICIFLHFIPFWEKGDQIGSPDLAVNTNLILLK